MHAIFQVEKGERYISVDVIVGDSVNFNLSHVKQILS